MKNKIPDLGSLNDISEYVTGSCYMSESEAEEPSEAQVTLPQNMRGRGNAKSSQSAIKLVELGPRLTLELVKIEEGLCDGEVLFHQFVKKTEQEVKDLKKKMQEKRKLKEKRKKQQEENVKKKNVLKQQNKERSLEGMKRKSEMEDGEKDEDMASDNVENDIESEDDDDAAYFRQEVGEEPDEEMFSTTKPLKRKRSFDTKGPKRKRYDNKNTGHDSRFKKKNPTASFVAKKGPRTAFKKGTKLKPKGHVVKRKAQR
eukprot:gene16227-17864_t